MKIIYLFILLLITTTFANEQLLDNFNVKIDKFSSDTTYTQKNKIKIDNLVLYVTYSSRLKEPALIIVSESDEWKFLNYHPLKALCDNQLIKFEHIYYDNSINKYNVSEFIATTTDTNTFSKLSSCKELNFQLGIKEFNVNFNQRSPWRILTNTFIK